MCDRALYSAINWIASDFLRLSAFIVACLLFGAVMDGGMGL